VSHPGSVSGDPTTMNNALTFDLEDYYHVTAFSDELDPQDWKSRESRLQTNTEKILQLLADRDCKATFFVLGWAAKHYPAVVSRVAKCGHEIACHSYQHRLVYEMTPEEFRRDTYRAKSLLEDLSGQPVRGYRAPSFSVTRDSLWALDVLAELGFEYDSSIFPVPHINYGIPDAPRFPFRVMTRHGEILEFPMPAVEFGGRRAPFGGGAYLRLLPYWYTRWAVRLINEQEEWPVCIYLHPWELDSEQPRMGQKRTARLRQYWGLRSTKEKLRQLLTDFEFCSLGSLIEQIRGNVPEASLGIATPAKTPANRISQPNAPWSVLK